MPDDLYDDGEPLNEMDLEEPEDPTMPRRNQRDPQESELQLPARACRCSACTSWGGKAPLARDAFFGPDLLSVMKARRLNVAAFRHIISSWERGATLAEIEYIISQANKLFRYYLAGSYNTTIGWDGTLELRHHVPGAPTRSTETVVRIPKQKAETTLQKLLPDLTWNQRLHMEILGHACFICGSSTDFSLRTSLELFLTRGFTNQRLKLRYLNKDGLALCAHCTKPRDCVTCGDRNEVVIEAGDVSKLRQYVDTFQTRICLACRPLGTKSRSFSAITPPTKRPVLIKNFVGVIK